MLVQSLPLDDVHPPSEGVFGRQSLRQDPVRTARAPLAYRRRGPHGVHVGGCANGHGLHPLRFGRLAPAVHRPYPPRAGGVLHLQASRRPTSPSARTGHLQLRVECHRHRPVCRNGRQDWEAAVCAVCDRATCRMVQGRRVLPTSRRRVRARPTTAGDGPRCLPSTATPVTGDGIGPTPDPCAPLCHLHEGTVGARPASGSAAHVEPVTQLQSW